MTFVVGQLDPTSLIPVIYPERALTISGPIAASKTIARGTRLGQITATGIWTPSSLAVIAAPTVAPAVADGAAGLTPAGAYAVFYTYTNTVGETTVSPVYSYTSAGTVLASFSAVTPLPTGGTGVNWYASIMPGSPWVQLVKQNNGAAFTVNLGQGVGALIAQPPTVNTAYSVVDGSATPLAIAKWDIITDSNGAIYKGTSVPTTGYGALPEQAIDFYLTGFFLVSDLPSVSAAEYAALAANRGAQKLLFGGNTVLYIP